MKKSLQNLKSSFFEILEIMFVGSIVFGIVYFFVAQLLEVSGDSMYPTLINNEQILSEKISINFEPLQRGEIVIFKHPMEQNKLLVKRVIALPNEVIRIESGLVYINGALLDEPYITSNITTQSSDTIAEGTDFTVSDDSYILMGDNREKSSDSRVFGAVNKELIIGRATAVYYPLSEFRLLKH